MRPAARPSGIGQMSYQSQSGDVVIFPGWVQHFTTPNESDKPRLMIGANYWLKGEMMFKDELDRIDIFSKKVN